LHSYSDGIGYCYSVSNAVSLYGNRIGYGVRNSHIVINRIGNPVPLYGNRIGYCVVYSNRIGNPVPLYGDRIGYCVRNIRGYCFSGYSFSDGNSIGH
jgi:hypothetical protein